MTTFEGKPVRNADDLVAASGAQNPDVIMLIRNAFTVGYGVAIEKYEEEAEAMNKRMWETADKARKEGTVLGYRIGYTAGVKAAHDGLNMVPHYQNKEYEEIVMRNTL